MFVRKFEADSVEEALSDIKRELGPEAIILKTVTNKGIKGAFKKNRIEVTAAISEKSYVKKASVDKVLNEDQKNQFYNGSASYIANMIDQHDQANDKLKAGSETMNKTNYGSIGLNKQVNSTKNIASQIKTSLDDFLSLGEKDNDFDFERESNMSKQRSRQQVEAPIAHSNRTEVKKAEVRRSEVAEPVRSPEVDNKIFIQQKIKIEELEKKLFELTKSVERIQKKEPLGIYQLRTTLRSLDINEVFIQDLMKKGLFELTDKDAENADVVYEFALREMMNSIKVAMPLFSQSNIKSPVITIFISEQTSGQSSIVQKIASTKEQSSIIKNDLMKNNRAQFSEKILNLNIVKTSTLSEIVSETRKTIEDGRSVFIDYKCSEIDSHDTKKFIDGMRRAFPHVEVLITLSAIHSEMYNRKILASYKKMADGIVLTHLDQCLNYGALFNINAEIKELPYKFFGTGEVVPTDLELASAERLMAGIFKI